MRYERFFRRIKMEIVKITYRNKPLSCFTPNDLPLKNGSLRNIISFSKNDYVCFSQKEQAQQHINYLREQVIENNDRYEQSFSGATEKLLKIIDSLEMVKE